MRQNRHIYYYFYLPLSSALSLTHHMDPLTSVLAEKRVHVEGVDGKGRGVIAASPLPPGTRLFARAPLVHVVDDAHMMSRCAWCLASEEEVPSGNLKSCTACKVVRYCGGECQKADWVHHKRECSSFKQV